MFESLGQAQLEDLLTWRLILGIMREKIYLPVQRGIGFKTAGVGNLSSS